MMTSNGTNGSAPTVPTGESAIADTLQEETTVGYRPIMPLEALWQTGSDMPQITLRRDLEFMQMHPVVMTALEYYKSGITGAQFWGGPDYANPTNLQGKPISPNPQIAQFVSMHVERFWRNGMPLLQEGGYPYGWAAGEHIYRETNGMLMWDYLKDFHPNDAFVLTGIPGTPNAYEALGIRVKNIKNREPVDLWFASGHIPAKACWYPHRPRFNQFYGRSQLTGAWRPWRRLGWRDAVEQVIDGAIYRAGYMGPKVFYPPGHSAPTATSGIPGTRVDGGGLPRRENREVARQLMEWAKAGAGFALSSEQYPSANGGGKKWDVEFPDHTMDVRPLIEGARYLEDQILLGVGVPPELVKAGGTGSGYSGRSIPREAFLTQQQRVGEAILQGFVTQVVRPLVLWNFGDVPFEITCKSLLQSATADRQGDQPPTGANAPQAAPDQPQAPGVAASLSVNGERWNRVMDIVRRVTSGRAA